MEGLEAVAKNLSTWIVLFGTGALVWTVQQVAPKHWVDAEWWKKVLVAAPLIVGGLIAAIPPLNPVPENMVHSIAIGAIIGTMSQSAYQLLRKFGPKKFSAFLGARAKRVNGGGE